MAEDFEHSKWWNNNSKLAEFDGGVGGGGESICSPSSSSLSCSTTTTAAGTAAFSWSPAAEISESKPTRFFNNHTESCLQTSGFGFPTDWNHTLSGRTERSFHSLPPFHGLSTKPFSEQELGESSSAIPFKDMNSPSPSSPAMLHGLNPQELRFQQPFLDGHHMAEYQIPAIAYHGVPNEPPEFFEKSAISQLQFTNHYPSFWNASPGFYPSLLPPSTAQLFESKTVCNTPEKSLGEDWEKRTGREPGLKKTRIEAHSPMPAFKVRKEKLGDRITALQQLVSPFGKTDTASVLHEAIEYIKFLHDQVSVLCTPYFKTGRPMKQKQKHDNYLKAKDGEESRQDALRNRGLCLVPVTSINAAPNDNNTTSDFWTPTYGRTNC